MKVILHIGAPKTGSSALQTAFVINRARLAERGLFYPKSRTDLAAMKGQPISGNATALAKYLNPKVQLPDAEFDLSTVPKVIDEAHVARCHEILYSSEFMSFFEPGRMTDFVKAAKCSVEIVYFVRNIPDHAMSSYRQHVRRGRIDCSFGEYAERSYKPPFSRDIEKSMNAVGRSNVTVLSYDDTRQAILPAFLVAISVEPTAIPAAEEINASTHGAEMTVEERAVLADRWSGEMRRVNELVGRPLLSS